MSDHRYHLNIFWYEPDGCWIADVPDLRGCSAHGETPEEAVAEARIAIDLWLEVAHEQGMSIPQPQYRAAVDAAHAA